MPLLRFRDARRAAARDVRDLSRLRLGGRSRSVRGSGLSGRREHRQPAGASSRIRAWAGRASGLGRRRAQAAGGRAASDLPTPVGLSARPGGDCPAPRLRWGVRPRLHLGPPRRDSCAVGCRRRTGRRGDGGPDPDDGGVRQLGRVLRRTRKPADRCRATDRAGDARRPPARHRARRCVRHGPPHRLSRLTRPHGDRRGQLSHDAGTRTRKGPQRRVPRGRPARPAAARRPCRSRALLPLR